jgi:uncharacterized protein YuzE
MRITYDPEVDILMVHLDETKGRRAKGDDLPFGGAYADLATDGTILAIEIEKASEKYPLAILQATPAPIYTPLTLDRAAAVSGMTVEALQKACLRGTLPASKVGNAWTVDLDDLNAYIVKRWKRPTTAKAG